MATPRRTRPSPGRPEATTRAEIERVAFDLFAEHGFDGTTLDMIATGVGVGRRTLFRYFTSKNDIPWGDFGASLDSFATILAATPADVPLWRAVHHGVRAFNDFDADVMPLHRQRMALILATPTLQAHSVLQYAAWRGVIAEFVADRRGLAPGDLLPRTVGHLSLALAISAYEQWLRDDGDLVDLVDRAMTALREHLGDEGGPH